MSDDCSTCNKCTFTIERSAVYHFNSYATDVARVGWEDDPEKMVNGLLFSSGIVDGAVTWINNRIQWLDENTATLQMGKPIVKVEIRAFSATAIAGVLCGPLFQYLRPVFIAGQGDTHSFNPTYPPVSGTSTPNWSQWFDVTSDTNAPSIWTWADVVALDMDTWMVRTICGDPNGCICAKVEVRVTWTESVSLHYPEWGGISGGLSKIIDLFNLWTVKTRDSGLNSQPFTLKGVMMPVCGSCFPICFPLCFGVTTAQDIFKTIHEWIEDHDEVTISCFGQCVDGMYVIKNFGTSSMHSPDNYGWNLTLEKVRD